MKINILGNKKKILGDRKKIRIPRIRKQLHVPLVIGAIIILLGLGMYFHFLPSIGSFTHMFEPEVTAGPVQSLADTGAPLSIPLAKPLIADFLASPENQSDPLSVQFFDMSRGDPDTWKWDFGDNTTSTDQNPVHDYTQEGVYNVTLTVTRGDGASSTIAANDVMDTRENTENSVLFDTIRDGIIKKGSFLSFVTADSSSSVSVNGKQIQLPVGSLVKIRADSDTTGTITLRSSNIMCCSIADGTLFVNGAQAALGSFSDCVIPSLRNYHANITFAIKPTLGEVRQILINGNKILAGQENSYMVVYEDSQNPGNDLSLITLPGYYEGSASKYSISPALIAGFVVTSSSEGSAPLNVSFMDQSAGSPESWLWTFGDGTSSNEQNPTHLYSYPGTYDVTLTVKNGEQIDTAALENAVIVTPPRVVANFTALPLTGPVPLTVKFTDLSTGSPTSWDWTFQETSWNQTFYTSSTTVYATSTAQNPQITFTDPGTYEVWLTVGNVYGSSDMLKPQYIVATPWPYSIPNNDIIFKTGKPGYLEEASSAQFVVSNTPASITINGTYHDLPKGATVRFVADSDQQGDISIVRNSIIKFAFPDMAVYVNGNLLDQGTIGDIYIPSMNQFHTNLTYYFSPNSSQTYETINGQKYLSDLDNAWIRIYNLGPDEQGSLSLISGANTTSIEGAENQTVQDWILQ
jgi:PKD repeat protein